MFKELLIILCVVSMCCSQTQIIWNKKTCVDWLSATSAWLFHCSSGLVENGTHIEVTCSGERPQFDRRWEGQMRSISIISTFRSLRPMSTNPRNANLTGMCLRLTGLKVHGLPPSAANKKISFGLNPDLSWGPSGDELVYHDVSEDFIDYSKVIEFKSEFEFSSTFSSAFTSYNQSCLSHLIANFTHKNATKCVFLVSSAEFSSKPTDVFPNTTYVSHIFQFTNFLVLKKLKMSLKRFSIRHKNIRVQNLGLELLSEMGIQELNLGHNNIGVLNQSLIPHMPTLEVLILNNANISSVSQDAFNSVPNLLHLNLAQNKLNRVPGAIGQLTRLKVLNLAVNSYYFDFSYNCSVSPCPENLDISGMLINFGRGFDFEIEKVQVLNLSHVYVPNWFTFERLKLPDVRILNLSQNPEFAEKILLQNLPHLHNLDLSENQLENKLNYKLLFARFPKLIFLNLDKNNIRHLIDFRPPVNQTPTFSVNIIENNTKFSELFRHFKNLRFVSLRDNNIDSWNETRLNVSKNTDLIVDLSSNNITRVHPSMLEDFSSLNTVILHDNPLDCEECSVEPFFNWLRINDPSAGYVCFSPEKTLNKLVVDVEINPEHCVIRPFNWLGLVGAPLTVLAGVIAMVSGLVVKYRWHLRYFYHLFRARMMKKRRELKDKDEPSHEFDAFVSYCSMDDDWLVEQLIPHMELEEPVVHLCIHDRNFLAGGVIMNNIIECIDMSRKSIFLITKNFIRSQWCQWELQMAQHKLFEDGSDVLILILLEELDSEEVPKTLKRLMATRTYLMWPDPSNVPACKMFWSRLKQAIGQCHCKQSQHQIFVDNENF